MNNNEYENQIKKLSSRIPFDVDIFETEDNWRKILKMLLEDSCYIALETLYPYNHEYDETMLPKKYYNWQIRCCIELYNLADKQGFTNYSENGLSFAKLSDGLSNDLMNKLTSKVGVPRKENI